MQTPVKFVKRIGARIGEGLHERGIETVEDLLYHLPFRYEDRLHPKPLSAYSPGEMASVVGEVRGTVLLRTRSGPIFEMTVGVAPLLSAEGASHNSLGRSPRNTGSKEDQSAEGASHKEPEPTMSGLLRPPPIFETVKCLWFHGAYLKDKFRPGQRIALYGKLEGSRSGNALNAPAGSTKFKMVQPTFEILPDASATGESGSPASGARGGEEDAEFTTLEMGRIVPVYPSLGGTTPWGAKLTSRWLRRVMWTIFRDLRESGTTAEETLPAALCERLGLPSRMQALEAIHFPAAGTSMTELMSARTPAHRRLIFEELWYLELGLELKRRRLREREGTAFVTNDQVRTALKQVLPFKPTGAQKRVLGEIVADMRAPRPMRRLLQGDVGSGKTIVALEAALVAIENGYQVAMMAPTEILATQHYLSARKLLRDAVSPSKQRLYRITLLTGSLDDRMKRDARGRIFRGETDLAIGTHALVEEKVDFENLGLVIVDEQHRFGVQQRFKLMRKHGASGTAMEPDVLVMTATPIPRTLALTIYGDLEASVLDELPPGRTPIVTRRMPEERADEVWDFVRKQVAQGRQAYIVYPIIEGERDDQPELDFANDAPAGDETGGPSSPPTGDPRHSGTRISKLDGNKGGPSVQPTEAPQARNASPSAKRKSAKAALYTSLGQRPRTAPKRKAARAEGPALLPATKSNRARLRSASEMFDELSAGALNGLKLGLLHGRMSADDKEVTMARFQRGEIDVLVSTTVIEVGVDVPNATVMVIEHAERFGLAQMHQLRGRVGRGVAKS
ncbi:MAG TPA: ATP-dependent DNA helicase RecG, partial [Bryocella sp.]|nr:ATP-dependent DNA helicase RecG [Bryocella sp.]